MNISDDVPERGGHGDVFSAFVLILSIAFCLQALGGINEFAQLRAEGVTTAGQWISRFTDPRDGEPYGIYLYEVGGKAYNHQQALASVGVQAVENGEPVQVIYLPDDPAQSRIAGTEGYRAADVLSLAAGLVAVVLAAQYVYAFYAGRPAWVWRLRTRAQRITDRRSSA